MPEPVAITTLDDPRVDPYRNVRDADLRGRDKLFMAESELVVRRLLSSSFGIHSLFLSPNKHERMRDALSGRGDIPIYLADVDLMSEIAGFHVHRGVLAAGFRPDPATLTLDIALDHLRNTPTARLMIAESITNVDNLGAMFRNAAAFGIDAIILDPTSCDPLYRKAIRVSMGHALSIPWAVCDDWPADLNRLRTDWNLTICAAEVTADAQPLWTLNPPDRLAFLFGAEGEGISHAALACCDATYMIPMADHVPSLNVAVASAICLYELNRGNGSSGTA